MTNNTQIPDKLVSEIITEATKLYAHFNQEYLIHELEQICTEVKFLLPWLKKRFESIKKKKAKQLLKRQKVCQQTMNPKILTRWLELLERPETIAIIISSNLI